MIRRYAAYCINVVDHLCGYIYLTVIHVPQRITGIGSNCTLGTAAGNHWRGATDRTIASVYRTRNRIGNRGAWQGKLYDTMVAGISNIDVTGGVYRHAIGFQEVVTCGGASDLALKDTAGSKLLDTVVFHICDKYLSCTVCCQPHGPAELTIKGANAAPLLIELAV